VVDGRSTLTVTALGDSTILDESSLLETLHVLCIRLWPGIGILGTTRDETVLEGNDVFLIDLALQIDNGVSGGNVLFLGGCQSTRLHD